MSYVVYIIQSLKDGRYYVGSTSDLKKRLEYHNAGRTRYTKKYQPWVLKYFEEYETISEAVGRERNLKEQKNIKRFPETKINSG
jgi:putative endonuclease